MFCAVGLKSCVQILQGPEILPPVAGLWSWQPPPSLGTAEDSSGFASPGMRNKALTLPGVPCQEIIPSKWFSGCREIRTGGDKLCLGWGGCSRSVSDQHIAAVQQGESRAVVVGLTSSFLPEQQTELKKESGLCSGAFGSPCICSLDQLFWVLRLRKLFSSFHLSFSLCVNHVFF